MTAMAGKDVLSSDDGSGGREQRSAATPQCVPIAREKQKQIPASSSSSSNASGNNNNCSMYENLDHIEESMHEDYVSHHQDAMQHRKEELERLRRESLILDNSTHKSKTAAHFALPHSPAASSSPGDGGDKPREYYDVEHEAKADTTNSTSAASEENNETDGKNKLHLKRDWYSTVSTFIAGGVAGGASRTLTAPLDRIKLIVQEGHLVNVHEGTGISARKHARIIDVGRIIYKDGGWRAFWQGNLVNCFKAGPEFAIVFSLRRYMSSLYDDCVEREQARLNKTVRLRRKSERVRTEIEEHERLQREAMTGVHEWHEEKHALTEKQQTALWRKELGQEASIFTPPFNKLGMLSSVPSLIINCTIGAAAGVGAQSVLYPMEVVKTRVVVSKNGEYEGIGSIIREAYAQGGLLEFYKGFTPNLVGIVVYRGLEMGIYSSAQQSIMLYRMQLQGKTRKEAALTAAEVGTVGMIGSTIAQTISYPLNVVRTRLQTQGSRGREKKYKGMIDCMVKMVRTKGVRSLFSGITANYLKAVPASGVTFMVFEKVQDFLVREEDD